MTTLYAIYLSILVVILGIIMLYDHHKGRVPLISVRNLAIASLIIFGYFSGIFHFWMNDYAPYPVRDPDGTGFTFTVLLTAFTVLFLLAYRFGWPGKQLARAVPIAKTVPSDAALLGMGVILLGIGASLRFVPIPYIGIIANYFGYGLLSVAAGFAGWTLVRNYFNPIYIASCGAIFAAASAVSIIGVYGRRGLVAVGAAFVWGAFYSKLRTLKLQRIIIALMLIAIPGLYLVAVFTETRRQHDREGAIGRLVQGMLAPNFRDSIPALLSGQVATPGALFVIENYPETFEQRPLHSLYYLVILPVPRNLWPDKPKVLSNEMATNALVQGVNRSGITMPPGIIGYIVAEGGIITLFVYAWFFGAGIRFFDQIIARSPWNPMIIMPVGAGLGQVLGLFRGDLSNFTFIYITGFIGTYTACVIIGKAFDRATGNALFTAVQLEDPDSEADNFIEPSDDPYSDYGTDLHAFRDYSDRESPSVDRPALQ